LVTLGARHGSLPLRIIRCVTRYGGLPLCVIRCVARLICGDPLLVTLGARHGGLPQSDVRFATRFGRLPLSDIRLVRAGGKAGLITLRADRCALVLRVSGLGVRSCDVDLSIGDIDAIRDQIPVCIRLFGQTHCGIGRLERLWRTRCKIWIGLQLGKLIAGLRSWIRLYWRGCACRQQDRGDCRRDQGLCQGAA
jgi:hypothetical protein